MRCSMVALLALSIAAVTAMPSIAATRAFPVPGFMKLRVEGPYSVHVHTGDRTSVNARGPAAGLDKLVIESRGDTLVISARKGWNEHNMRQTRDDSVQIDISVPMLESADLTGPGNVSVDTIRTSSFTALMTGTGTLSITRLDSSRLRANVNGSGELTISGRTGRADASVQGSGGLRGSGLAVDLLTASVAGSGSIGIGPTRVARASVVGSGIINIAGRPSCTKSTTGSGEIRCGE